ncbi:hypothetical protein GF351_02860 [Candidatus Woesearchaeota archaeon]|nr:hypothetical protein [Candidatus Woesearchaeota archaeon]
MIVSIHQPNYLPYIGFFSKMKQSDVFVIMDIAQYVRRDFHNRNRIKTPNGPMWLTIPVKHNRSFKQRICDIKLPEDREWAKKHWVALQRNYAKTEFFEQYSPFFKELFENPPGTLSELNEKIILYLTEAFGIKTKVVRSSQFQVDENLKATDLLINIIKKAEGDTYLSGKGREGHDHYIEEDKFEKAGIKLKFQEFNHPVYRQKFQDFLPNMAAVDLLFNEGENSVNFI